MPECSVSVYENAGKTVGISDAFISIRFCSLTRVRKSQHIWTGRKQIAIIVYGQHTHTTPALCNSIKWRCVCHKSVLLWWSTSICIAVHLQHFIARPKNNTAIHSILFLFLFVCVCVVLLVRCCQYFGISYLNSYIPEIQCKHITIGCVCMCAGALERIRLHVCVFVCLEYAAHLDFIGQSATHKIRYRIL